MIAGNATPSDARMMWNPSVNAIWLRAASSCEPIVRSLALAARWASSRSGDSAWGEERGAERGGEPARVLVRSESGPFGHAQVGGLARDRVDRVGRLLRADAQRARAGQAVGHAAERRAQPAVGSLAQRPQRRVHLRRALAERDQPRGP